MEQIVCGLAIVLLSVLAPTAAISSSLASDLTVNALRSPVDIEISTAPILSWKVAGKDQTAFQIQVAETPRALTRGDRTKLLDTGRIPAKGQTFQYSGPPLSAGWGYWWRVRIWGGEGPVGAWSRPVHFGTAPSAWTHAVPIWAPPSSEGRAADWAFLRGDIDLPDKPVLWAHIFVTGSSPLPARQYVYKLWINGRFVGLGPTQSIAAETRFDGFDVTSLVRRGANALGALAYSTADQRFLARLVVQYRDGSTQIFGTDQSWKALDGVGVFPDRGSIGTRYFKAPREDLDGRNWPTGFAEPGFDVGAWPRAALKTPFGNLVATPTAKVAQHLKYPARVVEQAPGSYFIDYGRTWVGGLRLRLAGHSGRTVTLRFGEALSSPQTVRSKLATGNVYEDQWTLRDGSQTLETWGLRVFRYVQITGAPPGLKATDFPALALIYPFDEGAASFASSSAELNSVWRLSRNSIEALNLNLYVDSWTRERAPYEADAYLQQKAALYVLDDATLGRYTFDYFSARRTWPTEWPLYVILGQYEAWRHSGDLSQLAANYTDLIKILPDRWLDDATGLIRKTEGNDGCASKTDCDIVDWPVSERDGFVFSAHNAVVNALSYRAYVDMAEVAQATGHPSDAARFKATAQRLRAAINSHFWDPVKGAYRDGISGSAADHYAVQSTAFALAFGVPTLQQAGPAGDYIGARGMVCSVYCAAFLIEGLYDAGQGDQAYRLLTAAGERSWLHMIAQGAGATMEAWSQRLKPNTTYSHPWASSPAYAIPKGIFGIQPLAPGYEQFRIKLQPGALTWAHVVAPTVKGPVGVAFRRSSRRIDVAVSIPSGARATILIPAMPGDRVYLDGKPRVGVAEPGFLRVDDVPNGCHVLGVAPSTVISRRALAAPICKGH